MGKLDENYFKMDDNMKQNQIEDILDDDETVLLRLKPKKLAFILNAIASMLPIALLWLIFDGTFITMIIISKAPAFVWAILVPFFAIHLMPVWMWISKIITAKASHKNIEYVFTEKRIIIRSGVIGIDFKNIYYTDIKGVNLKVGLIDRLCKVGDIYIQALDQSAVLFDIENPYFILRKIQKIVLDIKTDVFFPNNLRPDENSGFNTKYRPK